MPLGRCEIYVKGRTYSRSLSEPVRFYLFCNLVGTSNCFIFLSLLYPPYRRICMGISRSRRGQLSHFRDRTCPRLAGNLDLRLSFNHCQHLRDQNTLHIPNKWPSIFNRFSVTSIQRMKSQDSILLSRFFFPHFFPLLLSCLFTSKDHHTLSSKFQPTQKMSNPKSLSLCRSQLSYLPLAKFPLDNVIVPC